MIMNKAEKKQLKEDLMFMDDIFGWTEIEASENVAKNESENMSEKD